MNTREFRQTASISQPSPIRPSTGIQVPQKDNGVEAGPLGLNVVYVPEHDHKADIVFMHGLGGTSMHTWSKYKDSELFWPLKFLAHEPDICLARILSFGYNAHFFRAASVSLSILDFAKSLLFDLKYAKDQHNEDLNIGKASRMPLYNRLIRF